MDIYSLLDKNEKIEVALFRELQKGEKVHDLVALRKTLDLSKIRLLERLDGLRVTLETNFSGASLFIQSDQVHLETPTDFSLVDFLYLYHHQSINCQILYRLYEQGKLDTLPTLDEFFISESSYYRRIREINQVLAEFDLKIVNGSLQGDELQIRYFFFCFFWYLAPLQIVVANNDDPFITDLLEIIQQQAAIKLAFFDYHKFYLWLRITKKRMVQTERNHSQAVIRYFDHVKNKASYRQTRTIYYRFLSRYAMAQREEEVVFIYLFLISQFVLPMGAASFKDVFQELEEPVADLLRDMEAYVYDHYDEGLLDKKLKDKMRYSFVNTIYASKIFKGEIVYFEEKKLYDVGKTLIPTSLDQQIQELYQILYRHDPLRNSTGNKDSMFRLATILTFVDRASIPKFRIGYDYFGDGFYKDLTLDVTVDLLKGEPLVVVEDFVEERAYDLILTNSKVRENSYPAPVYLFSDVLSPSDLPYLRQIIKKFHLEKIGK